MSARAKAIKNLYIRGRIAKDAVTEMLNDGIITEAEYIEIVGVE